MRRRRTSESILRLEPDIDFKVVRSARRKKTIEIRVDRLEGVLVRAPFTATQNELLGFVRHRAPWIRQRLSALKAQPGPRAMESGESLPYRGNQLRLAVSETGDKHPRVSLDGTQLNVSIRQNLADDARRIVIAEALTSWYRRRAADLIGRSVRRWAPIVGRAPTRLFIRNQRRRWGSCSADGTLRFNWRLAMAEAELLDYVVVHELAHLVEMGHSPRFWAEVERAMPDYRSRRDRLKEIGSKLSLHDS